MMTETYRSGLSSVLFPGSENSFDPVEGALAGVLGASVAPLFAAHSGGESWGCAYAMADDEDEDDFEDEDDDFEDDEDDLDEDDDFDDDDEDEDDDLDDEDEEDDFDDDDDDFDDDDDDFDDDDE